MSIEINGVEKLRDLGRQMRQADQEIKKEFTRSMREAGKEAGEDVREAYGARLPRRGGLAAKMRRSNIAVKVRTSGPKVGAVLTLRNRHSLRLMEQGRLRHPVFGDREAWVEQRITKHIGATKFQRHKPFIQRRMVAAMERAAKQIAKG